MIQFIANIDTCHTLLGIYLNVIKLTLRIALTQIFHLKIANINYKIYWLKIH